jgi:hypothetical protein
VRVVEQIDLRLPLFGAVLGALLGALYHWRGRLAPAQAPPDPAAEAPLAEQRQRVASFLEQAARAMVAYSHMVDAANAADARSVERLFRALRAEETEETLVELEVDDRALRAAAHEFLQLHAEISAKVESRLAAGQVVQIGGELRIRAQELGHRVEALNRTAAAFTKRRR